MAEPFDLIVLGAGSAGVRLCRAAAQLGARVAVVEASDFGGTCVNLGCIPKKLMSYAAHYAESIEDARNFGWVIGTPSFDWQTLMRNKNAEIARLNAVYERLLIECGVRVHRGVGQVIDPNTIAVGEEALSAPSLAIATGGLPVRPSFEGAAHGLLSDDIFHLPEAPRSIIVYGGGYVAVEMASIFNGLGIETTLIYRGDRLLRGFDRDLGVWLAEEMTKKGIRLVLSAAIERLTPGDDDNHTVLLSTGQSLTASMVLLATGRVPRTAHLGLEDVGVTLGTNGEILVNEHYQSSVPSIYAIGDVTDRLQLTPVALAEGAALADHLFGSGERRVDYRHVATAVFAHPNVASVGLSEEAAAAAGEPLTIYKTTFRALRHTVSGRMERTSMKVVVNSRTDAVLGMHLVGPEAGEILQGFAAALNAGLTKRVLDATIGIHPTIAEEFVTLRTPWVPTTP